MVVRVRWQAGDTGLPCFICLRLLVDLTDSFRKVILLLIEYQVNTTVLLSAGGIRVTGNRQFLAKAFGLNARDVDALCH